MRTGFMTVACVVEPRVRWPCEEIASDVVPGFSRTVTGPPKGGHYCDFFTGYGGPPKLHAEAEDGRRVVLNATVAKA